MESFTPKQIEDIFTYMHLMDNGNGIIRQSEFFIYNECIAQTEFDRNTGIFPHLI